MLKKLTFGISVGLLTTVFAFVASTGFVIGLNYVREPWTIGAVQKSVGDGFFATRDYASALSWYRRAAAWNNAASLERLGDSYAKGLGVGRDDIEACKWYRRAISGSWAENHPEFRREVEASMAVVARRLSASQLADASTRAQNWKPRPGSPY